MFQEVRYTTYRNIFVERMVCEQAEYAIQIMRLEELPVENVKIIDCRFNNIEKECVVDFVRDLFLENNTLNGELLSIKSAKND